MKKFYITVILLFSISIIAACSDEERSFSIDDVTIDAQIQEDGTIHVRELFTYTFVGSYEGMTRSIESDVENFHAYLTEGTDPAIPTDELSSLEVEEEDNTYSVFSDSTDETKKVLYSYDVEGSVKKYTDVADITYAFFDGSNETNLNNVEITVHPPAGTSLGHAHTFLHEDKTGSLTMTDNGIKYTNSLLEAGDSSMIRFVFPAGQLTGMELDRNKAMEAAILAEEQELTERAENLEATMGQVEPILWVFLAVLILASIFMLIVHPNRYRGDKGQDALLRLVEKTDPLFVKYLNGYLSLPNDSFIAALFSLKRRGVVTLKEVPSKIDKEENTYRFTWKNEESGIIDEADQYLRSWLFTERDAGGDYFLLETLVDNEDESDEVKEEKAEQFNSGFDQWSEKVKERENYQGLRSPFKGFSLFSIPLLIASFGLFYYFTSIDTIGSTEQWVLPLVAGILTVGALMFNRNKWVLFVFYFVILLMTLIGFSLTPAVILTLVFYGLSLIALLVIPSYYWKKDIRQLKYAIHQAHVLFRKKRYPIGTDPNKIERRLEYAIVLGVGENYGEQCGKEEQIAVWKTYHPLLQNPVYATTAFSTNSLILYTVAVQNSSTTNTSATGGGGAGAF
ncbi:DUF2207 domain-containing protein [Virgibacillus ainsalahensis]